MAKESDGHVEACVESSGTLSQFRVRSVDSSALGEFLYYHLVLQSLNVLWTLNQLSALLDVVTYQAVTMKIYDLYS